MDTVGREPAVSNSGCRREDVELHVLAWRTRFLAEPHCTPTLLSLCTFLYRVHGQRPTTSHVAAPCLCLWGAPGRSVGCGRKWDWGCRLGCQRASCTQHAAAEQAGHVRRAAKKVPPGALSGDRRGGERAGSRAASGRVRVRKSSGMPCSLATTTHASGLDKLGARKRRYNPMGVEWPWEKRINSSLRRRGGEARTGVGVGASVALVGAAAARANADG
jgi:hypothetical protein